MIADLPEQGADQDALESMLIEALDGDDPRRAALLLRWSFIRLDCDRDDDRARIRESTAPVFRPI